MTKVRLGIDPGKKGALVAIENDIVTLKAPTPTIGNEYDIESMNDLIRQFSGMSDAVCVLEDVHSLGGISASANASLMENKGVWIGLLIANGVPLELVPPKKWQALCWKDVDKVLKPDKGDGRKPSTDTKATSLNAAIRLFPDVDLRKSSRSKIADEGIVDALLMAHYGSEVL